MQRDISSDAFENVFFWCHDNSICHNKDIAGCAFEHLALPTIQGFQSIGRLHLLLQHNRRYVVGCFVSWIFTQKFLGQQLCSICIIISRQWFPFFEKYIEGWCGGIEIDATNRRPTSQNKLDITPLPFLCKAIFFYQLANNFFDLFITFRDSDVEKLSRVSKTSQVIVCHK